MPGQSLDLRIATPDDATSIAAIYAPIVRDTVISFEIEPPTAEVMSQRIADTLQTHPWLVAHDGETVLGYAYASQHRTRAAYRWSCDVTAYVAENARGRGVGRHLYGALIPILKSQGFHAAFAGITLPNAASIGLHEAMGFRPLGVYEEVGFKRGAWHDVGWWRLGIGQEPAPTSDPLPFAQIAGELSL